MSDIWILGTTFETDNQLCQRINGKEAISILPFLVKNFIKNADAEIGIYGEYLKKGYSSSAKLIIRQKNFDADYFQWCGVGFMSERMRHAMALDPSCVRYFDIDDSQSAPLPRSKNYKMIQLWANEDVLDYKNSVYWFTELPVPDGLGPPYVYKLALSRNAAPTHDLFYDNFFTQFILCTDQLALRILKAGCTGVEFTDPRGYAHAETPRRRTLDGIEVYGEKSDPEVYRNNPSLPERYEWVYQKLKQLESIEKSEQNKTQPHGDIS